MSVFNKKWLIMAVIAGLAGCQSDDKPATKGSKNPYIDSLLAENYHLKIENQALKSELDSLHLSFRRADSTLKKQANLNDLRAKASAQPLEAEAIAIQNTDVQRKVLQAKSPFKKAQVRFLRFNLTAKNHLAAVAEPLDGQLFLVMSKGSMVQSMAAGSGSFVNAEGKTQLYTKMWDIQSKNTTISYAAGIGDAQKGVFEAGYWTLSLWFKQKGRKTAQFVGKTNFQIL